jgi:hypothetical protein
MLNNQKINNLIPDVEGGNEKWEEESKVLS